MILAPTVLILGAGASKPYGYPLGEELKDLIVRITADGKSVWKLFGNGEQAVKPFHDAFSMSHLPTIDDFLNSNREFDIVGRVSIAAALTVFCPPSNFSTDPDQDWYALLWDQLHDGADTIERFRQNRLKVITYNYDRSFERYFIHRFMTAYNVDAGSAGTIFTNTILVYYVHGHLEDDLDVIAPVRDLNRFMNIRFLLEVTERIKIIHDPVHLAYTYSYPYQWLREAHGVHILGFGFHETNLKRLDFRSQAEASRRWSPFGGTGLGLSDETRARASAILPELSLFGVDCRTYLREHARLT